MLLRDSDAMDSNLVRTDRSEWKASEFDKRIRKVSDERDRAIAIHNQKYDTTA